MARFTVPKHSIEFIVGKYHVGTPDAEVEVEIRTRCSKVATLTQSQVNQCVKYALKVHDQNYKLYTSVMTGRF